MTRLIALIDQAARIAGNDAKLAAAIGASRGNVSDWRAGRYSPPDRHILAMARLAGLPPIPTAIEIYTERLGKLAATTTRAIALGAVATLFYGANDRAQAAAANGNATAPYV